MPGPVTILYMCLGLSLLQTSWGSLDFQDYLTPSMFRLDDHIPLHREKRAAGDALQYYEGVIEISFSDPSQATVYSNFLQNSSVYASLPNITISSIDASPTCTSNGSYANCSCNEDYDCLGTSGPCANGSCICITPLPLQKFCIPRVNMTISPSTIFQGDTVTIVCTFSEVGSISWYLNSRKLSDSQKFQMSSSVQGTARLYTLNISSVTDAEQGNYTCSLITNGTSQAVSKTINKIEILQINPSNDRDSYCDGAAFTLTCCSDYIGEFTVTWTGSAGTQAKSGNCSTYTVTPSALPPLCPSTTTYSCHFNRNEGATASKSIQVTFIQRAVITIQASLTISAGSSKQITCTTSISDPSIPIVWAKDNLNNIVSNSKDLSISSATTAWAGIYYCIVNQRSLRTHANLTLGIVTLPARQEIIVRPLTTLTKECVSTTNLTCCVPSSDYRVSFTTGSPPTPDKNPNCYFTTITMNCADQTTTTVSCVVTNSLNDNITSSEMTIRYFPENSDNCKAENGRPETPSGTPYVISCQTLNQTMLGTISYTCTNGVWSSPINSCYSARVFQALVNVEDIINGPQVQKDLPDLLQNVSVTANEEKQNIQDSSKTLELMVKILSTVSDKVSNVNITVQPIMMQNFIKTVDIVVNKSSAWDGAGKQSVTILESVENFAKNLDFNEKIDFVNESISNVQLYGQIVKKDEDYSKIFSVQNLTGNVLINRGSIVDNSTAVITIAYGTMKDILPSPTDTKKVVNGLVMSTIIGKNSSINIGNNNFQINMSFAKSNTSLKKPECVWYDLDKNVWSNNGCISIDNNGEILCSCNHLTSFSILMGEADLPFLDIITYIGVGISLACLVATLLIEVVVWDSVIKNKTSYIRHVCLVNIAVTLLVADIWFIIGAALEKNPESDACKAAAFFSFFFYLSLFFWMLTTGLILFYRMIYIFHNMSRKIMLIVAFLLGYGCPLIISVITVAATEPNKKFTSNKFCWLDYNNSRSFLAFVVPVLTIVFANMLILVVVICKLLRPTIGEKAGKEERQVVIVIAKTISILTPLLGTTWGFGLGLVLDPLNTVVHGIFAALNSFQGLFILISTVLLDQKVRTAVRSSLSNSYLRTLRSRGQLQTSSTDSSGSSKPKTRKNPFQKSLFGKKAIYHFNSNLGSSDTTTNSYSVLT